jgi:NACHT N-terminal Helical domain 1
MTFQLNFLELPAEEYKAMPLDFFFATKAIGTSLAELLLKHFLGEPAAAAGKGLIEIAAKAIEDGATQDEARLRFEELGNKVVKRIQPLFRDLPDHAASTWLRKLTNVARPLRA